MALVVHVLVLGMGLGLVGFLLGVLGVGWGMGQV